MIKRAIKGLEMAETPYTLICIPGDLIEFKLTFTHSMNIRDISSAFYYQGEEQTNLPEISLHTDWVTVSNEEAVMETEVTFESDVLPPNVGPGGEYKLGQVTVTTFQNRTINIQNIPDIMCLVLPDEPIGAPTCTDFKWIL
jgi:hypothetical protein